MSPRQPPLSRSGRTIRACVLASVYPVLVTYEQLVDFVKNRMRMAHIYQPVMLMALLREGSAHIEVAQATLEREGGQGDTA